jgi:hypothetical protein
MQIIKEKSDKYNDLIEDVVKLVNEFDPECPDAGAYIDGHCSLYELIKRHKSTPNLEVIIEKATKQAHSCYDGRSVFAGINFFKKILLDMIKEA